jgi:hypothetical protein
MLVRVVEASGRPGYEQVPQQVREWVERELGSPVASATSQPGNIPAFRGLVFPHLACPARGGGDMRSGYSRFRLVCPCRAAAGAPGYSVIMGRARHI